MPGARHTIRARFAKTIARYSIAIASNQPFSGWTRTFTDPRLRAAIIDRLTCAGNSLETGTTSYRLAHARSATAHRADTVGGS